MTGTAVSGRTVIGVTQLQWVDLKIYVKADLEKEEILWIR